MKRNLNSGGMRIASRYLALAALTAIISGCSSRWPSDHFPEELAVKRTLFAQSSFGFREGCEAFVAELTREAATRIIKMEKTKSGVHMVPPVGWSNSPIPPSKEPAYYEAAFGGCNNSSEAPLGDLPGWLQRPGAFYKIINDGEGIAIIVSRAKLAGFYYFG